MIAGGTWTCPTCGTIVSTGFCPVCGERRLPPGDLTLRSVFHQCLQAFSNIDGRLLRSLRQLVSRPGALTVAYVQGRRTPYVRPFQLFLVANVVFFAMQSFTSTNVFSTTLDSHLHHQDWSAVAQSLVSRRLEQTHRTLDHYAPVFDQAVERNAKSLIILMVLPFALVLPLVFVGSRKPFGAHVVFSLHFHAFLLLLFCVALGLAELDVLRGGAGLASNRMDNILSVVNLLAGVIYLYAAIGFAYGAGGVVRIIQAAVLAMAAAIIVSGYRFVLLLITLYST